VKRRKEEDRKEEMKRGKREVKTDLVKGKNQSVLIQMKKKLSIIYLLATTTEC